MIEAPKLEA